MSFLENFNYQIFGKNEAKKSKVVLLHGLMGYGKNWLKIAQGLSLNYDVLTLDQRGHGASFKPPTGYAPKDYADDLSKILVDLSWQDIVLIGHSMGGRNAMSFAYHYPELIKALVVVDIGPEPGQKVTGFYEKLLAYVPTPFASKLLAKEFFMNEFRKIPLPIQQPQTLGAFLYSNLEEKTPEGLVDWKFSKRAIEESLAAGQNHLWLEWRQIRCPILLARGELSADLPRELYQRMLEENTRAKGVEIAGAGHWLHYEKPKEFLGEITAFLSSVY